MFALQAFLSFTQNFVILGYFRRNGCFLMIFMFETPIQFPSLPFAQLRCEHGPNIGVNIVVNMV